MPLVPELRSEPGQLLPGLTLSRPATQPLCLSRTLLEVQNWGQKWIAFGLVEDGAVSGTELLPFPRSALAGYQFSDIKVKGLRPTIAR